MHGMNCLKMGPCKRDLRKIKKDCFTRKAGACQRQGYYMISSDDLDALKIYNLR